MKRNFILFFMLIAFCNSYSQFVQTINFKDYFENKTMRVDYFHNGNAAEEHFAIDRILNDGEWAGSKMKLIDNLNLGLYFFEVQDKETSIILFNKGFASIFGEWQTISEAEEKWGTFHESVRFPWPINPVKLIMKKRDATNQFVKIWETDIDPTSRSVNPAEDLKSYEVFNYLKNGHASEKVDIVILGDGYTAEEMEKYQNDVKRLVGELFEVEPFKSRKSDFNVSAVETPSEVSGVNRPHPGIFKRTPLSVSYSSFDSERYALAYDNRTIRDVAATVPYEFMFLLINEETYGGGGIYRLYATVAANNRFSDYIFVHEFGHHFAGLADEYYTSSVSYDVGEITVEPYEPNITALLDKNDLKWNSLVEKDTPIPTPWEKEKYDDFSYGIQNERNALRAAKVPEAKVEALFERERKESAAILDHMEYTGKVGAFEGGGYMQYGLYRPYADCIMFTRNKQQFCPVCQDAISKVIDQYTK
ncbi:MAG: IgA Peptidase M64 [Bacteroidales bacterium]|nr:IgA Peptidase M64 [Bacteroidales bacterium]